MFGYVIPDKPYMLMKDYALYKSVYCGICKNLQKNFGLMPRLTTNYDSVFLSLFLHNYLNIDYNIERQNCVLHPFKKRNIALPCELDGKIVTLNVLLSYHKLTDDIIDGEGIKKRFLRFMMLRRAYAKAKKLMPAADEIIRSEYERLRLYEKNGEKSMDKAADCFALMTQKLCRELLGENSREEIERLFYNVGKWIYLIDALDDLEKDRKSGCYNPIIAACGNFEDLKKYKESIKESLSFTFNCIYNVIERDLNSLYFYFNTDILRNILPGGLKSREKLLMENCKCTKIRI
jgi:hypothetical protein